MSASPFGRSIAFMNFFLFLFWGVPSIDIMLMPCKNSGVYVMVDVYNYCG